MCLPPFGTYVQPPKLTCSPSTDIWSHTKPPPTLRCHLPLRVTLFPTWDANPTKLRRPMPQKTAQQPAYVFLKISKGALSDCVTLGINASILPSSLVHFRRLSFIQHNNSKTRCRRGRLRSRIFMKEGPRFKSCNLGLDRCFGGLCRGLFWNSLQNKATERLFCLYKAPHNCKLPTIWRAWPPKQFRIVRAEL